MIVVNVVVVCARFASSCVELSSLISVPITRFLPEEKVRGITHPPVPLLRKKKKGDMWSVIHDHEKQCQHLNHVILPSQVGINKN